MCLIKGHVGSIVCLIKGHHWEVWLCLIKGHVGSIVVFN